VGQRRSAGAVRHLIGRDHHVGQLHLEEDLGLLAGLAEREQRLAEMLAVGAELREISARLVDRLRKMDVLDRDLADTTTAALGKGGRVGFAPREGLDLDLVLVVLLGAFALDIRELQENIAGHFFLFPVVAVWRRPCRLRLNPICAFYGRCGVLPRTR